MSSQGLTGPGSPPVVGKVPCSTCAPAGRAGQNQRGGPAEAGWRSRFGVDGERLCSDGCFPSPLGLIGDCRGIRTEL
ncbi:hypothetical protein H8959_006702 [Pygathrix nigripes]